MFGLGAIKLNFLLTIYLLSISVKFEFAYSYTFEKRMNHQRLFANDVLNYSSSSQRRHCPSGLTGSYGLNNANYYCHSGFMISLTKSAFTSSYSILITSSLCSYSMRAASSAATLAISAASSAATLAISFLSHSRTSC